MIHHCGQRPSKVRNLMKRCLRRRHCPNFLKFELKFYYILTKFNKKYSTFIWASTSAQISVSNRKFSNFDSNELTVCAPTAKHSVGMALNVLKLTIWTVCIHRFAFTGLYSSLLNRLHKFWSSKGPFRCLTFRLTLLEFFVGFNLEPPNFEAQSKAIRCRLTSLSKSFL